VAWIEGRSMRSNPFQQLKRSLHSLVFYLLFGIVIALSGWLSNHHTVTWDWSAGARNTLSATSQQLLEQLETPLHVTSFAPDYPELRRRIRDIIARYQRYRPDINLSFVNPDSQPDLIRQLGIRVSGELRLEYQGRAENLQTISEESLSNAIQRLLQAKEQWIGVISGHGERRMDGRANHDLGNLGAELKRKGYQFQHLDLATTPNIPNNIQLLVIASPQVDLLTSETGLILNYMESGGNLLWLLDPGPTHGLDNLAQEIGLHILPGTVVDANSSALGLDDPAMALVPKYPDHPATLNFKLVSIFPRAAALQASGAESWRATPLLRTLSRAWNETGPIKGDVERNQEQQEIAGPLDIGIAFTREQGSGQQRLLVVGDGDFLTNAYLGSAGNLDLGLNLVRWLATDDRLLSIPARTTPDRTLELSATVSGIIGLGFLFILPLLFAASGALIWWHRRRL